MFSFIEDDAKNYKGVKYFSNHNSKQNDTLSNSKTSFKNIKLDKLNSDKINNNASQSNYFDKNK